MKPALAVAAPFLESFARSGDFNFLTPPNLLAMPSGNVALPTYPNGMIVVTPPLSLTKNQQRDERRTTTNEFHV